MQGVSVHDRNKWQMTATPAGPYSAAGRSKNLEGTTSNPRYLEGEVFPLFRPKSGGRSPICPRPHRFRRPYAVAEAKAKATAAVVTKRGESSLTPHHYQYVLQQHDCSIAT